MEKFIALLRGVNVGGKNKISMTELKAAFELHGFSSVATYINSGNILFESEKDDCGPLKADCEAIIKDRFGLSIAVNIIPAKDLIAALSHAPGWWNTDAGSRHNAIFVIPPATARDVFAQVGAAKPEYEKVDHYGRVIFWSAPIDTFSHTRWSKIVGTSVYDSITIRNANTAVKLAQLAGG